ncbi:MAG: 1-acyl-sn-glycerol-3-phosphate acyltransferase [Dysgonamonadaceae bacterium]|nr:1-acyl-sn-glycerol-3-phosphate acyltransferase [Dysgonamonadaceae bacterium]
MYKLYFFIMKCFGWKYSLKVPIPDKCVLCVAPHTSNWDFVVGMIFYKSIGGNPHILMKKEWFFFPINLLLKYLGGIPVDRKRKTRISEQMVEWFNADARLQLAIAPEGTRKKNSQWKTGFYYIALEAKVPITLAYIDYAEKEIGVMDNFIPTGDAKRDIELIKQYYAGIAAKHPKRFEL